MNIIDRSDFKMYVKIEDCKKPNDMKALCFIREEFDKDENIIIKHTYEFFMNNDEIKTLAKVLNDYEG